MKEFIALNKPSIVELDQHGVIEASAGTGKTYTLIELVMRALKEQRLSIDQILLVTFTEQATGELKSRIRARILAEINDAKLSVDLATHLKKALQQLNQASIFTIHGFCHRTLKEYAFEQSAVFDSQLVNDNDLREQMLHQMKRSWPDDEVLVGQLRTYVSDKSLQGVDDLLLELARQYKPNIDVFYPSPEDSGDSSVLQQFASLKEIDLDLLLNEFNTLQGLPKNPIDKNWLAIIEPFLNKLLILLKTGNMEDIEVFISDEYPKKTSSLSKFFKGAPAVYEIDHKKSQALENFETAPQLFALCDELDKLNQMFKRYSTGPEVQFIPDLLKQLNDKVQQHKLNNGLISYDDMITRLWEQLTAEAGQADQHLTQSIRSQYQLALIDEFQDTDLKQWEIFKQLFLCDSHKLFVIGDPKQAIYSFRGADVNTYRMAVEEIRSKHGGLAYRLNHNYRTAQPLVNALNTFFVRDNIENEQGGWFDKSEVAVEVPDENPQYSPPSVLENPHSIAPMSQIQLSGEKADALKQSLAQQIAETIQFQLLNQVKVNFKDQSKYIEPGDVCVLVRGRKDAEFIEAALQALQVPFSYHKKQELYQSIEAIHFQILLTALAEPQRKKRFNNLLISLFFDVSPKDISKYSENNNNNINRLWSKAKLASDNKEWVKVFEYMLQESGALFRHRNNSRRMANIKQLKQQLLNVALQSNCEAKSLLKIFRSWRERNTSEEALHQKDTEQSAVKIMTMHISKGLEFPVVFLMGGLTASNVPPKYLKFYDHIQQKTVFDLARVHQKTYDQQQIDEDQQLFYVAMTRAIFMLFLPNVVGQGIAKNKLNGAYAKTVMPRIEQLNIPVHEVNSDAYVQPAVAKNEPQTLSLPNLPDLKQNRSTHLYSFSSLSRIKAHRQVAESEFTLPDVNEPLMADEMMQSDSVEKPVAQIPGGVKTGLALHGVFENVSFKAVSNHSDLRSLYADEKIMNIVDEQMQLFRLENKPLLNEHGEVVSEYRFQLAAWVWHTLKKPLNALGGNTLGGISQSQRSHELSFFWHRSNTNLTGFIDLFFATESINKNGEKQFDYYILDWKSNLSINGYAPNILADEVMQKHQYNWQYELYALAMQRWFDSLSLKNACLKGALYVFSRGMDCTEEAQNGVFFDDFTRDDWRIDDIEADLLAFTQAGAES